MYRQIYDPFMTAVALNTHTIRTPSHNSCFVGHGLKAGIMCSLEEYALAIGPEC